MAHSLYFALIALLIVLWVMLLAFLKEGGRFVHFGPFVFSYLRHKFWSFLSFYLIIWGGCSVFGNVAH